MSNELQYKASKVFSYISYFEYEQKNNLKAAIFAEGLFW